MIGKKMLDEFNEQIKYEMESSWLYLSMATWFHDQDWPGMAAWMEKQAMEEYQHAMKFYTHIVGREGRVEFQALGKPKKDWESPMDAFQDAMKHEQMITGRINHLVQLAVEEKDNAAMPMLDWFISEQVEEEGSVSKVLQMMERAGGNNFGLLILDGKLGARQ